MSISYNKEFKMVFNKHQSFYFREGWLRKGMLAIINNPGFFREKDADQVLGLGKNMVASLRYWLVATGMTTEEKIKGRMVQNLTSIGEMIMKHDPYFELNGTLWVLHNLLASNLENATTWYWFFNKYAKALFDKDDFMNNLDRWVLANGKEVSKRSLNRDFDCLVRTYVFLDGTPEDILICPLGNLGLVEALKDSKDGKVKKSGKYRFKKPKISELDPLLLGWALIRWQQKYRPESFQVSLFELLREENSPGRLFNLSATLLIDLLNKLNEQHPDLACKVIRSNRLDLIEVPEVESEKYLLRYYHTEGII